MYIYPDLSLPPSSPNLANQTPGLRDSKGNPRHRATFAPHWKTPSPWLLVSIHGVNTTSYCSSSSTAPTLTPASPDHSLEKKKRRGSGHHMGQGKPTRVEFRLILRWMCRFIWTGLICIAAPWVELLVKDKTQIKVLGFIRVGGNSFLIWQQERQ